MLSADFLHLEKDVMMVNDYADIFHLDIMDGVFVPNLSYGFPVVEAIASMATKPLDVHLMIVNPEKYVQRFAQVGADMISFHLNAAENPDEVLALIRENGAKAGLVINPDMSAVGLLAGEKYSVEDLIHGVMFLSGNDATSALLWEIYGTEQAAVQAIREQLTDWGFSDFEFYTVSGIPNLYLPETFWMTGSNESSENKMSAADVALMSQYVVKEFPHLLEVTSKNEYTFAAGTDLEQVFYTSNQLLEGQAYGRPGITGLKSGMTDAAGRNFVSTSTENGREVITVVMGLFPREDGLEVTTYWETEILLDALADYPDLYTLEGLTSNKHLTRVEREAELAKLAEEAAKAEMAEEGIELDNRRNSPVTNFMRDLFNVFN